MVSALIVDDEPDIRLLIRSAVEAANHGLAACGEAVDGDQAIARWPERWPDVVVMDQRISGRSGMESVMQLPAALWSCVSAR